MADNDIRPLDEAELNKVGGGTSYLVYNQYHFDDDTPVYWGHDYGLGDRWIDARGTPQVRGLVETFGQVVERGGISNSSYAIDLGEGEGREW